FCCSELVRKVFSPLPPSYAAGVLVGPLHLAGDRPDKGSRLTGDGDDDLVDLLTAGDQAPVALTESDLRFPTDVLDHLRHFFQPELQVATDLGRVAIGPRALHEDPPRMRVARFGASSLPPSFPTGVLTGDQPQIAHELTGGCQSG